jgi:hypothetical protein
MLDVVVAMPGVDEDRAPVEEMGAAVVEEVEKGSAEI